MEQRDREPYSFFSCCYLCTATVYSFEYFLKYLLWIPSSIRWNAFSRTLLHNILTDKDNYFFLPLWYFSLTTVLSCPVFLLGTLVVICISLKSLATLFGSFRYTVHSGCQTVSSCLGLKTVCLLQLSGASAGLVHFTAQSFCGHSLMVIVA